MKKNHLILIGIFINSILSVTYGQERYPGFDVIGKGYDVFGEYANSKSITDYPIFNFSKMNNQRNAYNQNVPKLVKVKNISNHLIKTVEGSSKKVYISNLSREMGLSGNAYFFKASIENQFNKTTNQTASYFYYTYMDINTKWKVNLDLRNVDTLIYYLDLQFKSDLENLTPKELFEIYGTHFISSAYLGGRIDYSTTTKMNSTVTTNAVKTAINAKYSAIKGNIEIDENSKHTLQQIALTTQLNVVGGNSEFTNNISSHSQYLKWAEGIKTSPVLSGFNNKSLKPIWILTKNKLRQNELMNYFNNVILAKYPIPTFFVKDEILDNVNIKKTFNIHIIGFRINKDCDAGTALGGDEDGEFKYSIKVYANNLFKKSFQTEAGYVTKVWSGNSLPIDKNIQITIPLTPYSNIKIEWKLTEIDTYSDNERVGEGSRTHNAPFSIKDLYNQKDNDNNYYWKELLWNSDKCNADLFYQIRPVENKTARKFGSNGWYEFEKGNYDKCLYYSKEALKLDNSLWYVHFNVALVYMIQNNPRAFEKYKFTTSLCNSKKTIELALQDIINYEKENGKLQNSEPIILWLKSKI